MVDWRRVERLRSRGRSWPEIAADPKVGFHPDAAAGDPGRALRALYQRTHAADAPTPREGPTPSGAGRPGVPGRWTLTRVGYLLVPLVGVWFALAYFIPSPVGLLVPAVPYLALGLGVAAVVLLYALWRNADGHRWSNAYRTPVVVGVVLGLVVAGLIGLGGGLVFGCPYLPSSSSLQPLSDGWEKVPTSAWKQGGAPVAFFYGAVWCPYCSASSWALWKALTEYGSVTGAQTRYSYGTPEPYAYTPEMILAGLHVHSSTVAYQVSEYNGSADGVYPATSSCTQQAYVSAYDSCATCGIPFIVLNGQYVHVGALYSPAGLSAWNRTNDPTGAAFVEGSVHNGSGSPWQVVQNQTWWIMAFLAKGTGASVPSLASQYGWDSTTTARVWSDVNATS